jgi:hypothetical protein
MGQIISCLFEGAVSVAGTLWLCGAAYGAWRAIQVRRPHEPLFGVLISGVTVGAGAGLYMFKDVCMNAATQGMEKIDELIKRD